MGLMSAVDEAQASRGHAHAPHYPTRESDSPAYVGTMVDMRQARICTARDAARKHLQLARAARIAGDGHTFEFYMIRARQWRQELAKVLAC